MAKITIEELSGSLKEYLNGLGLTEAQVQELIDKFEDEKIGDISQLSTEEKGSLVGAINELFQNANNGKELIANAIGEPLNVDDTFSAMSNDINGLLSTFKTNMMNNGITVESSDRFKSLIDKIATMVEEGSGKGIQFAEGTLGNLGVLSGGYQTNTNVTMNLDFIPNYIFINMNYTINNISGNPSIRNMIICNMLNQTILLSFGGSETYSFSTSITNLSSTGFTINISGSNYGKLYVSLGEYYAIGVGEEDTTLRDSLASILQEEGVNVSEEDDMASLITKINDLNIINTDKNQIMTYKVDEITYNIDFSNPGLDYFNAFVKGEFIYFIVQDAGTSASNYLERTCYCKFIKYNMNTKTIVLEKVHQNYDNDYRYRIDAAYLADDAIYIIAEFGLYSVNLNDFNVTQIVRNTYNSTVNSKTFRIGDVIYFTADGYNYDYSAIVRAYNVKTKQLISELTFPRISTGADRDEYLYFMCPDLINDKIYFAGGDTAYPLYQTDLNLNVIKSVNLSGTGDLIYKINSRYAFANSTTLSIINQGNGTVGSFSAYPNVIEINVDNLSSNYTTRSLNCECFFDVNASVSTISTYSYRQAPCIEYYSHYMFIKHEDTFVRLNTLDGTAVNVPIPVYFKIFRVIDEETIECITRTGISTFRIKEI